MLAPSLRAESVAKTRLSERRSIEELWAASAVLIGIAVFLWAFFGIRESTPPQADPVPISVVPPTSTTPTPEKEIYTALYESRPELGDRVGTISLPTLKLNWPIYEGTTEGQLAKGVGHFVQSVLPGETDNTVLSGHRTTVFNKLGDLATGDKVLIKTSAGTFTYQVRSHRIVLRTDRTVIVPTETAVLTLTTCYPFNNFGATKHAYVVVADLVEN